MLTDLCSAGRRHLDDHKSTQPEQLQPAGCLQHTSNEGRVRCW